LKGGQNCGVPFSLFSKKGTPQYKSKKTGKTTWENCVVKETRDYMENFEYKDDKIERIQHSEGVITQRALRSGESTEFVGLGGLVWQYEYTLKDHLGNTRVTFADIDGSRTIQPNSEINQINHYYPFGLNMEGNWNGAAGSNKYQLTGKEWNDDFGLGMNDFGARMYARSFGVFGSSFILLPIAKNARRSRAFLMRCVLFIASHDAHERQYRFSQVHGQRGQNKRISRRKIGTSYPYKSVLGLILPVFNLDIKA
jgi:hypothetical protein